MPELVAGAAARLIHIESDLSAVGGCGCYAAHAGRRALDRLSSSVLLQLLGYEGLIGAHRSPEDLLKLLSRALRRDLTDLLDAFHHEAQIVGHPGGDVVLDQLFLEGTDIVAAIVVVNLVEEQFDVAIRPNPQPDSTLVGKSFAKDRLVVVAAPSIHMPRRSKRPVRVPDIVNAYRDGETWIFDGITLEPIPVLRLSSMLMLRDAAIAGAGVAQVPQSIVWEQLRNGALVRWGEIDGKEVVCGCSTPRAAWPARR